MKKITFLLCLFFAISQTNAQVSSYVFSQTSGIYTPISGGLLLGSASSDDQKFIDPAALAGGTGNTGLGLPIGFNFTYNGLVFDRIAVNNNGWISFGQSALTPSVDINSTSSYTPLASTVANTPNIFRNRIAGIAADLQGQTGSSLRVETIGVAPNRTLVVQWTNYRRYLQTGSNLSFQIRLNETVNTVDVVFDTLTFNATSSTANIGLGGTVSTDFDNRTTTTNWNSTIAGSTNADSCTFVTGTVTPPASGLTLTWTPGPLCTGMPSAGTSLPASLLLLPTQAVGNLVVSDYTPDVSGLTFQWQESLDNGATWNNASGGTNATTPTYTPPVFAGSNIQYRLSVTCTATSDVAFSTISNIQACGSYPVPVLEPLTTFLPTCWQEADNGDLTAGPAVLLSGSWLVDGFANSGTTGAARVTLDAATDNDWVISPLFTIPATGYELKFDAAATQSGGTGVPTTAWESDDYVEVLVSTAMNNWTVLFTYNGINVPSNTGAVNIIDLDAYSGQNVRFAFRAVEGAANGAASIDFFIDNFEIRLTPTCIEPLNLVFSGVTSSTVNISWDDTVPSPTTGFEYFVSTTNTVPVAAGTATTSTFAAISGLLPQTTYYVFVRSNCSTGDFSSWTGPITFTTTCAPVSAPLLENFATFLPSVCWFNRTGGDLTTGPTSLTGSGWVADGFANAGTTGAVRNEIFTTGANDWLISPEITIPATGYELKFDAAATQFASANVPTNAWESDDSIEVLVSTTSLTNWTPIFTYNSANQPSNAGTPNIIDLDAYSGQNVRFAFRAVEGATNGSADIDFSIDNFQIRLTPSCIEPLNLVFSGVTSSTVNISWDDTVPSPTTGFEYFVSTTNTVPVAAGTATTSTFAAISGLLPQTTYYVFVRSNCSTGDFSSWTGPITFTTTCAPVSAPLLENFATFLPSVCWFNRTGGDLTTGPTSLTGSGWVADGFANAGTTGAVRNEIFTTGANDWLISPEITIPATGYELKFDAAATQFASANVPTNAWESDDSIEVLVSTTSLTNWTPIFTYNSANQPSNAGTPNIIDLDAYSGQNVRFAFRAVEGATNGSADIDFSIDNFQIRLTPSCIEPLNLVFSGVTSSTVNISWDDTVPSPTTGFEYFVSTTNTVPVTAGTATTSTFAALSGLLPQTTYYIFVRSDCSAGDFSSWTGPISFTTACTSLAIPWLENFDALATGTNVFPTCWAYTNTLSSWSISTAPVAFSGANSLRRTWSTNGWAFTPMFTLTAGTSYTFSYYVRTNDATVGYDVTVGVGNSQTSAAMVTTLSTVVGYQGPAWTLVTLEYTPSVSGDYSFGVQVVAPLAPNGINFDNFELKLTPPCPAPIASVSGVTDTSANISWPAVASASSGYEYVLDNVATDPAASGTSTMAITYSATGLTASTLYYFHVRSACSAGTYSTWSTVSFTTPATPPVNDNCSSAIALTPGATFATNPLIATNVGATGSTETAPGCAIYDGGDVWYSVIVPASGNISLETGTNAGTTVLDTGLAVYSGVCGALALVECDDDDSTSGAYSLISLTGRTPGELLYIRAWEYDNDAFGTFTVSAYDASLSSDSFDKSTFVAYPNPVKDVLNLSYKTAINNVRVVNLLGQEVLNTKTNSNDVQVNMSTLTAGAYIVNITFEDAIHTIKVIKQ